MKRLAPSAAWLWPMLAATLGACHPRQTPPPSRPAAEGTVGPATAFAPRILSVDVAQRTVTFRVDWPVQVLLVSVTPAQFAVPVGALTSDTTRVAPGIHTVTFVGDLSLAGPAASTTSELNRVGYDRCVRTGTRNLPTQRVIRRDSAGKPTAEPRPETQPHAEATLEQSCREANRPQLNNAAGDSRRYLVLIATNTPMMLSDAIRRFEAMRDIPNDVAASVQAVATALYADRNGSWSAHYVLW